ncbi:MAG: symmetrical bis(5'-nucleosyl)-tetraphosphatase [Oxalobacteraceae bacterium]|nr:symmetrical bis(5'-nucleosyl)-tetraphosphatase [Oxalobacteraceae bacterium]
MTTLPVFAVGDLQGCLGQLDLLLDGIEAATPDARFVFVGDLVNRGPDSLGCLRRIRAMGDSAQLVLGNHDLHLLAVAHGIRPPGRSDTLDDLLAAPDRDDLLNWLRQQPLALMAEGHLIVHAGVLPQWTTEQTLSLADEVSAVLRGSDWLDFLAQMYGNEPARWRDDLQGANRLRCVVNALTRVRFCTAEGAMEFATKEGPDQPPSGYMPWFDVPARLTQDTPIVFGHWSTLGLILRPNIIGLDTGCVWGGKLSALRLSNRQLVQVDCPQHQKPG